MRIVTKVSLVLVGVVSVSLLIDAAALELAVRPSFESIEQASAADDHARVIESVGRLQDRVRGNAIDYGRWDDTYEFIQEKRPDFVAGNITLDSIRGIDANHIAIIGADGTVLADVGFDFSKEKPAPVSLFQSDRVARNHPFLTALTARKAMSGLIRTERGLLAVGMTPVVKSDTTGEPKAVLAVARLLSEQELRTTTKVGLRLEEATPGLGPEQLSERQGSRLSVASPVFGLAGTPVARLTTEREASITAAGERSLRLTIGIIVSAALVLGPVFIWFMHRTVVGRIEKMQQHIRKVAASGRLSAMEEDGGKDELGEVQQAFNAMAAQLEELRGRLRESDYRTGAADYAAGVLHNVRNAITPVATISSELAAARNAPWKANLTRALGELKEHAIDEGRAEKLRRFVALSAERLVEEDAARSRDVSVLADMVRQVASTLMTYAEASELERVCEPVDLARTVAHARRVAERRADATLRFDFPGRFDLVVGREPVLNEIFANLFINAAESIGAAGRGEGTIRVTTRPSTLDGAPALAIEVADDGNGFDERVNCRLFERGFSTKAGSARGVGLHWCANAVRAIGGTIEAASPGIGHGAMVHLTLRLAAAETARAA